jgi:hypothetical protein
MLLWFVIHGNLWKSKRGVGRCPNSSIIGKYEVGIYELPQLWKTTIEHWTSQAFVDTSLSPV